MKVFYHVWCNNHWQHVVIEQLVQMRAAGLRDISAGVIGSPEQIAWVRQQGIEVVATSENAKEYEALTLCKMHEWCKQSPGTYVCYCHAKGVGVTPFCIPWFEAKEKHRRLMMRETVCKWKENVARLEAEGANAME